MDQSPVFALLVASVALLVAVSVSYAAYRVRHPFTRADLEDARTQSARLSRRTRDGLGAEQVAPLVPEFPFQPEDARFVGRPLDYLIFDGLSEGRLREIVFLEVKAGNPRLNGNERMVRDAVREGRVSYEVLKLG